MGTAKELVEKGAAMLDQHFGEASWVDRVAWFKMDIADDQTCLLGQLFGDYGTGLDRLGLRLGYEYGFDCSWDVTHSQLNVAWRWLAERSLANLDAPGSN